MEMREGGLDDPRLVALLAHHAATARGETAPGSAHALDLAALMAPGIRVWSLWEGDRLLGTGALKALSPTHGEVKAMHVAQGMRRTGAGRRILAHIVAEGRRWGMTRLSLETGSWPFFHPAHALYRGAGFVPCAPFGGYAPDPNSLFMTLALREPAAG